MRFLTDRFWRLIFTLNSDTKITTTIPKEGIEARGMTTILLSGGTNDTVSDFEVLLDTAAVKFNVLGEGDVPGDTSRTSQYSIEETQDGVVYIVTKTRFPDGTTAIISSVSQALKVCFTNINKIKKAIKLISSRLIVYQIKGGVHI